MILWIKFSKIVLKFSGGKKMAKVCEICGKKPIYGHNVSHSHKMTNRRWLPNLQKIKVVINGEVKRMRVCTSCIRSGRVKKAV